MELTGNLRIDLSNFDTLSRKVGYLNAAANTKNDNDEYDPLAIDAYEKLRSIQIDLLEKIINTYSND